MRWIFLAIFILLTPIAFAATYNPINYVSDYADIIDAGDESNINALAAAIQQNSTVEIAVLTVPSLDTDINQFAVDMFKQWGIGKKDVDNGLLILIAPNEREWRIEVGYGLEPVLTDAMAGRIGREHFTENFRAGNYGNGIYDAIADIGKIIQKDESVISKYSDGTPEIIPIVLLFLFLVIQTIIVFATSAHKKKLHIRLSSAAIMAVILLFLNVIFAIIFFFFALSMLAPFRRHGPGFGGFSGRGLGGFRGGLGGGGGSGGFGGFGGFGGGSSGGGGAGGKW